MKHKLSSGFTLVELIFVVSIIGILAAIALPAYDTYVDRSKAAEALTISAEARTAINEFYQYTGKMPADNEEAGLAPRQTYRGNVIVALSVENGAIHVDMQIRPNQQIERLTLRPLSNPQLITANLQWACGDKNNIDGLIIHGIDKTTLGRSVIPC